MKNRRSTSPEPLQITIEKLIYGGAGLGHHEGKVVFVPFTAPGDRVEARIVREKKNFIEAEALKTLTPGPDRRIPPCPYFGRCGGCQWQHLDYARQLESKRQILLELFHHRFPESRKLEVEMHPSPVEFGYRSRARIQLQGFGERSRIGFYRVRSHRIEDVEICPLLTPGMNRALAEIRTARLAGSTDPGISQMELASSPEEGNWQAEAIEGEPEEDFSSVRGIGADPGEAGPTPLLRTVGRFTLRTLPSTFFQANVHLVQHLVNRVCDLARTAGRSSALELFSGVGLFTLPLALQFEKVTALESSQQASRLCAENAAAAGLSNVETLCSDASVWMEAVSPIVQPAYDLVVLDPPRSGAGVDLMRRLLRWTPETILYVSCDPQTLVRDLSPLVPNYYRIDSLEGLDLFPQTYHFETLVRLLRR